MKTIVLVKQVPDVSQMAFDPVTRTLRREGVRLEVSGFDVRVLLRAVALRQAIGGEVVVMTMGPPQARDALVHCLALGADRAIHLVDPAFAGADTLATARALAAAIRREGFDLVLCGRNSVDAETGQVGPEVAELLDVAQVTAARTLDVDWTRRRARAERETEDGFETVECFLPAVVTGGEDIAPERFPRRAEKEAAAKKPIAVVTASDLADDVAIFGLAGSPTWVEAIQQVEEKRAGEMIEGAPAETIPELVRRLRERGVFEPRRDAAALPGAETATAAEAEREIWVVAETLGKDLRRVSLELLGKAGELARASRARVAAVLLGHEIAGHAKALAEGGADRVLLADDPVLGDYTTDAWSAVLARAIERSRPLAVLLPSSILGRDLAPRVAARLGLGLTGDCIDLGLDDAGRLVQWKPAFGGNVVAPILSRTSPAMATVRPGMLAPARPRLGAVPVVERLPVIDLPAIRTLVVDRRSEPGTARAAALDDSEIAVGVGKGIGGPEALREIESFADALGAAIAAIRDVTDEGWLPRQHQVGLTGRAIAPRLYIAIGIRGAFEHVVGLRRAGTIVTINKDPKSPMFRHSDLGVVADWAAALPILRKELEPFVCLERTTKP